MRSIPFPKAPKLKDYIPDWLENWQFDRFVTLAINNPSMAERRLIGSTRSMICCTTGYANGMPA